MSLQTYNNNYYGKLYRNNKNILYYKALTTMENADTNEKKRKIWLSFLLRSGGSWYTVIECNQECFVCYSENTIVRSKWKCNHKFCIECIQEIQKRNDVCPLCRSE